MSSTVSVLGTVLGPIHTTLLGLFHPRTPQTLWNSGGLTGGSCSHVWNSPPFQARWRSSLTPTGVQLSSQACLFSSWSSFPLTSIVAPPFRRLIEIHRHGLGNFSDSNKTQRMDRSWGGRAYSEMDCLPLTGMGGVKCATIRFTHGNRRPLRSCRPPKVLQRSQKVGKLLHSGI